MLCFLLLLKEKQYWCSEVLEVNVGHRVTDQPRLEGTSKDHLVQHSVGVLCASEEESAEVLLSH